MPKHSVFVKFAATPIIRLFSRYFSWWKENWIITFQICRNGLKKFFLKVFLHPLDSLKSLFGFVTTVIGLAAIGLTLTVFIGSGSSPRTFLQDQLKTSYYHERAVEDIRAGQSRDYVVSKLGVPKYSVSDNDVREDFFETDFYIMRTFSNNGSIFALTVYSLHNEFNPRIPFYNNNDFRLGEVKLGEIKATNSTNRSLDAYLLSVGAQFLLVGKSDYGFGVNDFNEVHAMYFSKAYSKELEDNELIDPIRILQLPSYSAGATVSEVNTSADAYGGTFCNSEYYEPAQSTLDETFENMIVNSYTDLVALTDVRILCESSSDLVVPDRNYWRIFR